MMLAPISDADLVRRYRELDDWIDAFAKHVQEQTAPAREEMESIKGEMLRRLNERSPNLAEKANSKTEFGTAFRVRHFEAKVVNRDGFLKWCIDRWSQGGNDMFNIKPITAEKGELRRWIEENRDEQTGEEKFPPGLEIERTVSVNIRKA